MTTKQYAEGAAAALEGLAAVLRNAPGKGTAPTAIVVELFEGQRDSIVRRAAGSPAAPWRRSAATARAQGAIDAVREAVRVLEESPRTGAGGASTVALADVVTYLDRKAERWRFFARTGVPVQGNVDFL